MVRAQEDLRKLQGDTTGKGFRRQSTWIEAEHLETRKILRCEVFVDELDAIGSHFLSLN